MKKEWTEQDLRAFAENAQTAFEDVTLTEADEEAAGHLGRTMACRWIMSCAMGRWTACCAA